ncbi:hypothetical protein Mpet_0052 [Methanolacinia petrolearia DSM 11571]|uniref:Uncharacterized protein n=1 Tax=Methanolacinia petrolearia (strain DSM 11571 / OCM 486 / SEBR 4847) TaxID=679926 RepID=E1RDE9_METP4|nr:hypothetical protein [Methanolacinia petrolearia]ADN34833.1 hypothetical protein Mpet_0052 [Methanolacinia petrolearia DSM 11571]
MELTGVARGLDRVLYIILFVVLVFFSLMNLFVFIINWETWFFGIRLAGLNAGIVLFIYFLVPAILAYLLYMYPGKTAITSILSVFFFVFTFISSSITTIQLSNGVKSFNGFMAIFVVISLAVLAGHLIAGRFYDREEYHKENNNEGEVSKTDLEGIMGKNPIYDLLIPAIAAFFIVLLFGIAMLIPALFLLIVISVIMISKRATGTGERSKRERLNMHYARLLFAMGIMMIIFVILLYFVPVFFMTNRG